MTKPGKCDSCRQRKVKCDEGHPTCAVCRKGGRLCTYTYGKAARFVNCQEKRRSSGTSSDGSVPPDDDEWLVTGASPVSATATAAAANPVTDPAAITSNPSSGHGAARDAAVVLSLRSTREAKSGSGLFHTFVPLCPDKTRAGSSGNGGGSTGRSAPLTSSRVRERAAREQQRHRYAAHNHHHQHHYYSSSSPDNDEFRSSSPPCSSESPQGLPSPRLDSMGDKEKLLARWLSLLGPGGPDDASLCPIYTFGDWISLVAPRIGESEPVQWAATCLIDSIIAYVNRTGHNFTVASQSKDAALRSIRMSIQCSGANVPRSDVLVAIKLLFTVELFMGAYTQNYRRHAAGLVDLLYLMCCKSKTYDEITQQIFYASFISDATAAILGGRDSVFDEPFWLSIPPPPSMDSSTVCPDSSEAWSYIMRTFVRIPRLVRLIREAKKASSTEAALTKGIEAQALALELFETDLEDWVQGVVNTGSLTAMPAARADPDPYGTDCFTFASPRLFIILTTYWMTRILLCGCVQALCDLEVLASSSEQPGFFNAAAARAEDILAATNIAMCAQYAFGMSPVLPVVPLRLQMPLLLSFAAWHRREARAAVLQDNGRDTPESNAEGAHAHVMKQWCARLAREINGRWNGAPAEVADLEVNSDCFTGGPLSYLTDLPPPLLPSLPIAAEDVRCRGGEESSRYLWETVGVLPTTVG